VELNSLHEEARKNIALLTQLIAAVMERLRRTRELLAKLQVAANLPRIRA
jgi:hypothetical protein